MSMMFVIGVLAVASLMMVAAMVEYSKRVLASDDPSDARRNWLLVYLGTWIVILAALWKLAGPQWIVFAVPAAYLAVHFLILRFGIALRDASKRDAALHRPPPRVIEEEEEEEEEIAVAIELPWFVKFYRRLLSMIRWAVAIAAVLLVIGIGENIAALHRLDAALANNRELKFALIAITAGGWAIFMTGIIRFILSRDASTRGAGELSFLELKTAWRDGTWRDSRKIRRFLFIGSGALLMTLGGAAFAIAFATPGIKLLIGLAVAYAAVRIAIVALQPHP